MSDVLQMFERKLIFFISFSCQTAAGGTYGKNVLAPGLNFIANAISQIINRDCSHKSY